MSRHNPVPCLKTPAGNLLINPNILVVEARNHFSSKQWPAPNLWKISIAVRVTENEA